MALFKKYQLLITAFLFLAPSIHTSLAFSAAVDNAQSINKSDISLKSVLVFADEAILFSVYNYSFLEYEKQLEAASQYFTAEAWKKFKPIIEKSRKTHSVIKNKMLVLSVSTRPPVVLNEGIKNGIYTWKVQMPILVTYENATTTIKEPLILNLEIIKTSSETEGVRGLVIKDINVIQPPKE